MMNSFFESVLLVLRTSKTCKSVERDGMGRDTEFVQYLAKTQTTIAIEVLCGLSDNASRLEDGWRE